MKNSHLNKRVMAALVSSTMVAGVAVAPNASAASWLDTLGAIGQTAQSYLAVNGYEPLPQQDLKMYDDQMNPNLVDNNIGLLKTEWGAGWCVDWGNQNPWDPRNSGYEVRKLTGASGHYGDGAGINEDVRIASINVMKSLMEDYKKYQAGQWQYGEQVKLKSDMLRALLSNNKASLNEARSKFYYANGAQFRQLTGFNVTMGSGTYGFGGVYLTPDYSRLNQIKATVGANEYVTILVPKNYSVEMTKKGNSQYQRIITIIQPGIGNPPKQPWTGTETVETKTVWSTPPASRTTVTETLPPQTEVRFIPGKPVTTTQKTTLPATVETKWETLPPITSTYKTTVPGSVITSTVQAPPVTRSITTTENGTPRTSFKTETPEPSTTKVTVPGQTKQVVTTVTERPVVTTRPAREVVTTKTVTPTKTTVETKPATTTTVTREVTPARVPVSTTTVTVNENYYYEKYYERVRELHEYYYFAGFARDEKSKEIELPGNITGNWSFEITQGEDIVIVERTGDGKLKITPREGFEGEGTVEIVITDQDGNQHVFRVKVTNTVNVETSTNVQVNNFFYTIDPTSKDRIRVIDLGKNEKATWRFIDANGNEFEPKPGTIEVIPSDGQVKVEVKDPSFRGNVVVRITDKEDNVRENIVTVENKTTQFNYQHEILNSTTAMVERRGGSYKVVEGDDLVNITTEGDNYRITPKPGVTGTVRIVFTDDAGNEYNYTLKIRADESKPFQRADTIDFSQTVEINSKPGWRVEPRTGGDIADITPGTNKDGEDIWVVKPTNSEGGTIIIDIFDGDTKIGEWTIRVAPEKRQGDFEKLDIERNVADRSLVSIYRGVEEDAEHDLRGNVLEVVEGEDLIDKDRSTLKETGAWLLRFNPEANGTVRVRESQWVIDPDTQERVLKPVTEFIYKVKPGQIKELNYEITADTELTLYGTRLNIKEGSELLAEQPKADAGQLNLDLKRDAKGTLVIENSTPEGFIFERYTIKVTEGQEAKVVPSYTRLTWNGKAHLPVASDDTVKIVKGQDLLEGGKLQDGKTVIPAKGQTGEIVIEASDKRGKWAEYHIEIVDPGRVARDYSYTITTDAEFRANLVGTDNKFELDENAKRYFQEPTERNGEWILKPKSDQDAIGKVGVVIERDKNGREINRYTLTIAKGRQVKAREQRRAVEESGTIKFPFATDGGTFRIVSGREWLATAETQGKEFVLKPKKGSVGQTVHLEERNSAGEIVRVAFVSIVADGSVDANGNPVNVSNVNLQGATINNNTTNGSVNIDFPKGVVDLVVTDGADKVTVTPTDGGVKVTPKPNVTAEEIIKYILVDAGESQSYDEREIKINVQNVVKNPQKEGSSDTEKCLAAVLPALAPLLLLIPVGILAQVQIPGLEGVSAQINAAIREANDYVQRGLGIYNPDKAAAAANIGGKFAAVNPEFIGLAAGSLGIITAGLLIADAVMRSCGAGQYTSSYQIGKAIDSETLMGGSSGEIPEVKPAPEKKDSTSKVETNVSVTVDGKDVATNTTGK